MSLFDHIEALQGDLPWGRFLDAGTGVNSSLWSMGLTTDAWTGVTAAAGHADQVRASVGARFRSQEGEMGQWSIGHGAATAAGDRRPRLGREPGLDH